MRRTRSWRRVQLVAGALVVLLVAGVAVVVDQLHRPLPTHSGSIAIAGLDGDVTVTRDARGVPTIVAGTTRDLFLTQGYTDAQDRFFLMDYRRHVASGRLSELVGTDAAALHSDEVVRTLGFAQVAAQEWTLLSPAVKQYLQAYSDGVNAYLAGRSPASIAVEYTLLGLRHTVAAPAKWQPTDSLVWLKAMAWDLRTDDGALARASAYRTLADVSLVDQLFPGYPSDLNAPILTADEVAASTPATAGAPASTGSSGTGSSDTGSSGTATPTAGAGAGSSVTGVPSTLPSLLSASAVSDAFTGVDAAVQAVPGLLGDTTGAGSDAWVVSGRYTTTGTPLLASDPQLGLSQPGVWSQVGLRCAEVTAACPFDVSGFSLAGFPGVVVGHDAHLAWGLAGLDADTSDYYLERVVGDQVLVDGALQPLTEREEVIDVADGDPVRITVRSTRHGPLVSDVLDVGDAAAAPVSGATAGYQVSLAWAALTPGRTAEAVFALDTASSAADVTAAAALLDAPAQSIVWADTDGHIGYQAAGRVPVRASVPGAALPSDGTWPMPGWDTAYDWQGWVDVTAMPRVVDPAEGFLVAANQQVAPAGSGPALSSDTDLGYRAQRIRTLLAADLLGGTGKVNAAQLRAIATDTSSPAADVLVPTLLSIDIGTGFDADGQKLLRTWDRRMDTGSAAAVYFAAVLAEILRRTFSDDLPDSAELTGDSRSIEVLRRILDQPSSSWWDDRATPRVVEGRDEVLSQAMIDARRSLTARLGADTSTWRWGTVHQAALRHPVLGGDGTPSLVRDLVDPSPVAVGGGSDTVDTSTWDASATDFTVTSAASLRMVVDLSDLDSSTWVDASGTSGHPADDHYDDQLAAWAAGDYFAWPFSAAAVTADAADTLALHP